MSDDEDNKPPEAPEAAVDEARVEAAIEELTQATLKFEREILLEWWTDEEVYDPHFPRGATLESSMREALAREAREGKVVQLGDHRDCRASGPRGREPFYSEKATELLVDYYLMRVKLLQASREAIAEVLRRREEAKKGREAERGLTDD